MAKTIDEYIQRFPNTIQNALQEIRVTIRAAAPDADECISYGIPTLKLNGNLVHFAAFKEHIGFYPTPSGIEKFKDELSEYETSKGTIKFPLNRKIPYDLIKIITEYRVSQQLKK